MNYNLLDEDWIPVLYRDGDYKRVGIRKALEDAGRIREIAASNPMDRVAILRFLLALLYWCKGNPSANEKPIPEESFPSDWFTKLDDNKELFNLLGNGGRFYQNEAYREIQAEHTTNYLMHEVPSGSNKCHFRHSTDGLEGLCPACCAMGLVRLPVFATSGGKGLTQNTGKSPGINAKPPVYYFPHGVSLAIMLRLSWRRTDQTLGTPEWETPNLKLPKEGEVPLLAGMTWLPRSIWLHDPEDVESVCISCGSKARLIRRCVFDGKGSSKSDGRIWRDPHVIYQTTARGEITSLHASDALGNADAGVGQWTKLWAGILRDQSPVGEHGAWTVGFSTVQNDKYLEAVEEQVSLPVSSPPAQEYIEIIERWRDQGSKLTGRVQTIQMPLKDPSSRKRDVEVPSLIASVRPHVEHRVSARAGHLLANGDEAWDQAAEEYRPMMEMLAKSLSPGFTTEALERRNRIAAVMPNMHPTVEAAKKQSRKKREEK
ncbi:type I-E CRISPR-associated protein Cse1/CasA [Candidatus Sumerlaeota bacterium]|nr:type I-E CRISPR-associated protein Cse1/CasA [Candidatus Sumerlaeota bacterium]